MAEPFDPLSWELAVAGIPRSEEDGEAAMYLAGLMAHMADEDGLIDPSSPRWDSDPETRMIAAVLRTMFAGEAVRLNVEPGRRQPDAPS